MQNLGTLPGGAKSEATAISTDSSAVAGVSGTPNGDHTSRWTSGGSMQDLGVLSGGSSSLVFAICGDGSTVAGSGDSAAFFWAPALGMVDLNTYLATLGIDLTGWTLDIARGISADGSTIAGDGTFNGEGRSSVITGVPTPGAVGLLGLGGLVAAHLRR